MGLNQETNISEYREAVLSETEFKKAGELDSSEFENIRKEFIRRNFVIRIIGIVIAATVAVLWNAGVFKPLYVYSNVIKYAFMFLAACCIVISIMLTVRCITSLIFFAKINRKDFYWHAGRITVRKKIWIVKFTSWDHYYIIDDEYCSRVVFNPHYSKGTEVYYLYFPEFWKSSYMGGLVVRRK